MFILDYINIMFFNTKQYILNLYEFSIRLFFKDIDAITLSRLMSVELDIYKTLVLKNIKLKKLKQVKTYVRLFSLSVLKNDVLACVKILYKCVLKSKNLSPC